MAITLADASVNARDDVSTEVIDEFRKSSWLLDQVPFDDAVSPAGGGATLTYGYTRVVEERPAQVRNFNEEVDYSPKARRSQESVNLIPFGAGYTLDRVLANLGPAATNEVAFQTTQAQKSTRAKVHESMILGATQTGDDALSFDGLDALLAGSTTEQLDGPDLSAIGDDRGKAHDAIDALDELLGMLDGTATALLGNRKAIARIRSLARRAGYHAESRTEFGQNVESYNGVPFVDLGARSGSSQPIIPVVSGLTDVYAVRIGLDGFHGVTTVGSALLETYLPDFTTPGAVKRGEVEFGPVGVALKATKAAAVFRGVRVDPAA